MSEETVKCSEVMKSCKYAIKLSGTGDGKFSRYCCDYIGMTGKRRGCNPEECDKYITNNRRVVKSSNVDEQPEEDDGLTAGEIRMRFRQIKSRALKAARDLGYGEPVMKQLRHAESEGAINSIMKAARHERFK